VIAMRRLSRRSLAVGVAVAIAGGGGTAWAVDTIASIVGSDGVIHGCYAERAGSLRVVAAGSPCAKGEQAIQWNQQGPAGATGSQGPAGAVGSQGPAGPAGQAARTRRVRYRQRRLGQRPGQCRDRFGDRCDHAHLQVFESSVLDHIATRAELLLRPNVCLAALQPLAGHRMEALQRRRGRRQRKSGCQRVHVLRRHQLHGYLLRNAAVRGGDYGALHRDGDYRRVRACLDRLRLGQRRHLHGDDHESWHPDHRHSKDGLTKAGAGTGRKPWPIPAPEVR
jgi:hypothetical protein